MSKIYGYCRISSSKQNIERQERNILREYPDAIIVREVFTGRNIPQRKELVKLLRIVKAGDMIIFDTVSRMSRDAEEGFALYEELYGKGVEACIPEGASHRHSDVPSGITETVRSASKFG